MALQKMSFTKTDLVEAYTQTPRGVDTNILGMDSKKVETLDFLFMFSPEDSCSAIILAPHLLYGYACMFLLGLVPLKSLWGEPPSDL